MTQTSHWLLLLGLTVGLAAGGYAYQRGQASQQRRLARISTLADQINVNNQQRATANAAIVRSMARIVCLNHNWGPDAQVLTQAQQIQARTRALLDTVGLLRRQLQSGGEPFDLASPLAAQLDRYTAFMQRYASQNAGLLRLPPMQAGHWDQLDDLPLPAAVAALSQLDAWLRRSEAQTLLTQAEKLGVKGLYFDRIEPLAVPISETVAPGGIYQAQLFLAQASHRDFCNLEMTANGVPLTQPSAPGMQFAVPARRPGQPHTVRAHWHGTIRAILFPPDTVLQLDVPYLIVQRPTR